MKVLNVYYTIKDGRREEYVEKLVEAGIPQDSRSEPGNGGRYAYYYSEGDENELLLVEYWKDQEAFETHKEQEHYKRMLAIQEQYVTGVYVDRFDTED